MRGAAVLWVVLHHAFYSFHMSRVMAKAVNFCHDYGFGIPMALFRDALTLLASRGFFGVNLFFVISGFLITGLLIESLTGKLQIGRFYLRRFFKIIPHYYFVISIVFIPLFVVNPLEAWPPLWQKTFSYLFFFQSYNIGVSALDHTWSMVVEEQFYVFWAVFLFILSKYCSSEGDRWRIAFFTTIILIIAITVNRFYFYRNGVSLVSIYPMVTHETHGISLIADCLMIGSLLRLFWHRYPEFFRNKSRSFFAYALGIFVFIVLLSLPASGVGVPDVWYAATLSGISPLLFIIGGLGGVAWGWQFPWLRQVGLNSYGLYLVHYPLLLCLRSRWAGGGYIPFIIYIALVVFLGFLTTTTIEKYFLDLRKKISP